jgi:hypothetical protein
MQSLALPLTPNVAHFFDGVAAALLGFFPLVSEPFDVRAEFINSFAQIFIF